ncbi:MAG: ParB/RepB/Spo0J family partition protein [Gammaproteobacteria bacterium]|nr:ParB/RepB/Spo0J family partition protein [Gammaproteobacteria bacterium]
MITKRRLGRGLNELLMGSQPSTYQVEQIADEFNLLPIEYLHPGKYQPRQDMNEEALEELAESIKSQGIIQPIVVRFIHDNHYEIIAGERRWRAAQLAGLKDVPVLIKDISDEVAVAMSLIENIQRENLNPLEEAGALRRLLEEFGMTQQQVADVVGKSRATVTNLLRLLSLNKEVKKLLEHGDLEMGHARALLSLEGQLQNQAAQLIVSKELSVRETEKLVKKLLAGTPIHKSKEKQHPDVISLQNQLSDKLGAKVAIQHNAKGKGKLVISFNNLDELDGIFEHFK